MSHEGITRADKHDEYSSNLNKNESSKKSNISPYKYSYSIPFEDDVENINDSEKFPNNSYSNNLPIFPDSNQEENNYSENTAENCIPPPCITNDPAPNQIENESEGRNTDNQSSNYDQGYCKNQAYQRGCICIVFGIFGIILLFIILNLIL